MGKTQVKISILMPVKNAAPWLEECIVTIQSQSFEDWELIAVDDHSTDMSATIIQNLALNDHRIKLLSNDGSGIVDALNTALNQSSARAITRMDADDVMPQNKLELFWNQHQKTPEAIITGRVKYFSNKPISEGYLDYESWLNERCVESDFWDWIYRECVIASANWLAPKSAVFFKPDIYPEDYHLVLEWFRKNLPVVAVDAITHLWREHPRRTSRTSDHYQQEAFFKLKVKHFVDHQFDSARPLVVMGKNQKSKITQKILKSMGIKHAQIDLEHLHEFAELENPQVLVAVYPKGIMKESLANYLAGFDLIMGADWWWV